MRIQGATGYALRIMQYISEQGNRTVKANEIAEELNISYLYMIKLLGRLKNGQMLISIQGCNGGFRLAKAADKITVFEVYTAIEGDIQLYQSQTDIQCSAREAAVQRYFDAMEDMIVLFMRRTSVRDLFQEGFLGIGLKQVAK